MPDRSEARTDETGGGALAWWWSRVELFLHRISPCRISIGSVLLGGGITYFAPQSIEAIRFLSEGNALSIVVFEWTVLLWAHNAWYFSRVLLRFSYASEARRAATPGPMTSAVVLAPRVIGTVPFVAAIASVLAAGCGHWNARYTVFLFTLTAGGVAFVTFVWQRRAIARRLAEKYEARYPEKTPPTVLTELEEQPTIADIDSWRQLSRGTLVWSGIQGIGFVLAVVSFTAWPVPIGQFFGASTVFLLACATWIALGSLLTYTAEQLRLPVVLTIVLVSVFCSRCNDNHGVDFDGHHAQRPALADDFRAWQKGNPSKRWFFVVTEGGGIRAAYWTASVLARLEKERPGFSRAIYGISSVSGGSVGAGVYVAALANQHLAPDGKMEPAVESTVRNVLSVDSLGPLFGKGLFPDLLQRVLPVPIEAFDRGRALEQSWARSFEQVAHEDVLARPFLSLYPSSLSPLPRLFLNSTVVETGARAVVAYPQVVDHGAQTVLADGVDVESAFGDASLVSALHLSARFPWISPPGRVPSPDRPRDSWGHLVDGGYFENSGAATGQEVIDALRGAGIEPFLLVIRYRDDVPPPKTRGVEVGTAPPGAPDTPASEKMHPIRWGADLFAPVAAILNTRDARGVTALESLRNSMNHGGALNVADFILDPPRTPLPLGWVLAADARAEIHSTLDHMAPLLRDSFDRAEAAFAR